MKFFLDSGAYSAFTKGVEIDIYEYCDFIKTHSDFISHYSVLDDINCPETTLKNQKIMEGEGLEPVPCFHYGEDIKYLEHYLKNYKYISLGGMVPISEKDLVPWLDNLFSNYICNKHGYPIVKIHGFGLTIVNLIFRYPWYSVDSTTWARAASFGEISMPQMIGGDWSYTTTPTRILLSTNAAATRNKKHYIYLSEHQQQVVQRWIEEMGFKMGKSEFNEQGEETIIEEGVSNNHQQRKTINALYFARLQKKFPSYPGRLTIKKMKGLF